MSLGAALAGHPDELRADLQQFYGLDLDRMGEAYTAAHAAALVRMLPRESRLARVESPALEWSEAEYLLARIEHTLRVLAWQRSKDGQHGRNYPEKLQTPYDRERARRVAASSTPEAMRYVADRLGIPEDRR